MKTVLSYDLSYYDTFEYQMATEKLVRFSNSLLERTDKIFSTKIGVSVSETFVDMIDNVVKIVENLSIPVKQVVCYNSCFADIECDDLLISLHDTGCSNTDLWKKYDRFVNITVHGLRDNIKPVCDSLISNIKEIKFPSVRWEYLSGGERDSQDIKIERAKPIFNEFYPWIGDVHSYFDRYLKSESSILVLLGETGTAKTSFIRSMMWYGNLNTVLTYEEELLRSDSLFVDFITSPRHDLMVVEDADLFLTSREHDGNKVMSKFLNIGDGLVSIGKKKIIFTANITEPAKIDNALLRAGRCFDCQIFRRLSYAEACAAAKAASIPVPEKEGSYTLAELFSFAKEEKRSEATQIRKFGFGI